MAAISFRSVAASTSVEQDILDALASGQLSGATLDVFHTEPLPKDHPFWSHPQIVLTPHDACEVTMTAIGDTILATAEAVKLGAAEGFGGSQPGILDGRSGSQPPPPGDKLRAKEGGVTSEACRDGRGEPASRNTSSLSPEASQPATAPTFPRKRGEVKKATTPPPVPSPPPTLSSQCRKLPAMLRASRDVESRRLVDLPQRHAHMRDLRDRNAAGWKRRGAKIDGDALGEHVEQGRT